MSPVAGPGLRSRLCYARFHLMLSSVTITGQSVTGAGHQDSDSDPSVICSSTMRHKQLRVQSEIIRQRDEQRNNILTRH